MIDETVEFFGEVFPREREKAASGQVAGSRGSREARPGARTRP